ncbi:putative non-structural protein [Betaentomopoxvirus amoorei]|uniref:AMV180 n=1 Tax=Amsacta moorei entomopoxvirus TaxID=28321 RepID=Q9EMM1_AMEPV|nr:putative non-structural protein [Amsacta moorei entomopoxvirus]AAG02886.1 AMV180 [Amsacta moorei entomopoxvirus]
MEDILSKYELKYKLNEEYIFNEKKIKIIGDVVKIYFNYLNLTNIMEIDPKIEFYNISDDDKIFNENELYISEKCFFGIINKYNTENSKNFSKYINNIIMNTRENLINNFLNIVDDFKIKLMKMNKHNKNLKSTIKVQAKELIAREQKFHDHIRSIYNFIENINF